MNNFRTNKVNEGESLGGHTTFFCVKIFPFVSSVFGTANRPNINNLGGRRLA